MRSPSLPTRERGLKQGVSMSLASNFQSLPTRERGLKLLDTIERDIVQNVAPYTGAWIETHC